MEIVKPNNDEFDQRYFPRWEVENRIVYQIDRDSKMRMGQTKDLSCVGACIAIEDQLAPKQNIKMTVYLAHGVTIDLKGRIIWIKPDTNINYVGINFIEISHHAQDLILKHAFQINKDNIVKSWFKGWEF